MEQKRLCDVKTNEEFEGYLLLSKIQVKESNKGNSYVDMTLRDKSAEVNAKFWNAMPVLPQEGKPIHVKGIMLEYLNKPQFKVESMRPPISEDEFDIGLLVPAAPYPPDEMLDYVLKTVESIKNQDLKKLVEARLKEVRDVLWYFPAAQKLHHAERSGLLHHMTGMLKMGERVCLVYKKLDRDLLVSGVILHDLCKIDEMTSDKNGIAGEYTIEGNLLGHLVMGVREIERVGKETGCDKELLMMIEHMIISHHELPEYGSPKLPMFPEAEVLHILDLLDARMFEMFSELEKTTPGHFTDRIWSLDRKLYRRQEKTPEDTNNM